MDAASVWVVVTTVDSRDAADQIANQLVTERWAACVQVSGPITSVYRWQGAVEVSTEWRMTIKTHAARVDGLIATLADRHPYQVPQIVAWPADKAHSPYAAWVGQSVGESVP